MKVAFRVDASIEIGNGHVMRCLALAEALRERGVETHFLCREHSGNLITHIREQDHIVHILPIAERAKSSSFAGELAHSAWLGVTQEEDADACAAILDALRPDWLIVDHYALDVHWEKTSKPYYGRLMVIDDLADRQHCCDLLLDQNLGRNARDYENCVPENCDVFIGPQYALLRPEFARLRESSLKRRYNKDVKRLLVAVGGVDKDNVTGDVLNTISKSTVPIEIKIDVVLGSNAPHLESVKKQAVNMQHPTEVMVDVKDMAKLMLNADLAVGAPGTTTWERCSLGLPTLLVLVALNQHENLQRLEATGAARRFSIENLEEVVSKPLPLLIHMSILSSALCDAHGAQRLSEVLCGAKTSDLTSLFPASADDCEYVFRLQNIPGIRKYFRNVSAPYREQHVHWFSSLLKDPDRTLFIIMVDGRKAGIVRLDGLRTALPEVSIIVSPDFSGMGIATKAIDSVISLAPSFSLKAVVHVENTASKQIFEKNGFVVSGEQDSFITMKRVG